MSLSPTALASVEVESKVNQPSFDQKVKEEESENQQQKTNIISNARLERLVATLHKHIASYLSSERNSEFCMGKPILLGFLSFSIH